MPVYEYECKACGERFELRRGFSDSDSEVKCPKCGTLHPQRRFSLFATASSARGGVPSGST